MLLLALLLASDVTETFKVNLYPVDGATRPEVRRSMNLNRPAEPNGKRFDALTSWHVDYDYQFVETPAGCRPGAVRVKLSITMNLPDTARLPPATRAVYESYVAALKKHEDGHVQRDRAIAEAVATAVHSVPAQPTCQMLDAEVHKVASEAMRDGDARNARYDADTQHGARQGIVAP